MSDTLAGRLADNQIRLAMDDLLRAAARLAEDARLYADSLHSGSTTAQSGRASRLAQVAEDLSRNAARLDGMRDIAAFVNRDTDKEN